MTSDFLLGIVNTLGVFALLTLAYGRLLKIVEPTLIKSIAFGIVFGMGASLAIANAAQPSSGVYVDPRAVMLTLAGPFGGAITALVAAAIAATARLWSGGIGAPAGIANIFATAGIGVVFSRFVFDARRPKSFYGMLCLGLVSNIPFLLVLTVPVDNAIDIYLTGVIPLAIANTLGVLILGHVLRAEHKTFLLARQMEAAAFIDPLTGLPNRRCFQQDVDKLVAEAKANGTPLSVLVVDIDFFKRVNDMFGHDVGDIILIEVAEVIRRHVRGRDIIARFGGEEVVMAMPDTGVAEAAVIADRIRSIVDGEVFHAHRDKTNVTVSIGVATRQGNAVSFKDLFKVADDALYRAKERGRNRVEIAAPVAIEHAA